MNFEWINTINGPLRQTTSIAIIAIITVTIKDDDGDDDDDDNETPKSNV